MVAHARNLTYLGDRDQWDCGLRLAQAKVSENLLQNQAG
jgi:hypothetical protein